MFGGPIWKRGVTASQHSLCAAPLDRLLMLISLIRQGEDVSWLSSMKVLQDCRFISQ